MARPHAKAGNEVGTRDGGARWRDRERGGGGIGAGKDKADGCGGVQIYCAIGFARAVNARKESVMDRGGGAAKGQCIDKSKGSTSTHSTPLAIDAGEVRARAYSLRREVGERRPDGWASWGSSGGSAESGLERNAEGACPQRVGGEPWKTCVPAPGGGRERGSLHAASDEDEYREGGERVVQYRGRVWGGRAVRSIRERERAYDQGQQPVSV